MFNLKIYSHHGLFYDSNVESLTIRTSEGFMTVLENHSPLFCAIRISKFYFIDDKKKQNNCLITGGILYVKQKATYLVGESVYYDEDINKQKLILIKEHIEKKISDAADKKISALLQRDLKRANDFIKNK